MIRLLSIAVLAILFGFTTFSYSNTPDFQLKIRAGRPTNNWETRLRGPGNNTNGQYDWISGNPLYWKLDYNSTTSTITFFWDLDNNTPNAYLNSININAVLSNRNSLRLWTRNNQAIGTNGSLVTDMLSLTNGGSTTSLPSLSVVGPSQTEVYFIPQNITDSFMLTGRTTLTWEGTQPRNNQAQFTISDANTNVPVSVPEPSTFILIGASAALARRLRRRKP